MELHPMFNMGWALFAANASAYLNRMWSLQWLQRIGTWSILILSILLTWVLRDVGVLPIFTFVGGLGVTLMYEWSFSSNIIQPELKRWWDTDDWRYHRLMKKITKDVFEEIHTAADAERWLQYYSTGKFPRVLPTKYYWR